MKIKKHAITDRLLIKYLQENKLLPVGRIGIVNDCTAIDGNEFTFFQAQPTLVL